MIEKWCKAFRWGYFSLFGVVLLVSGCASPQLWYKPGHSPVDFDLDHQECLRMAEEIGRQATLTGDRINLEEYNTSYNNCLFSRGWTHTPPGKEQKKGPAVALAQVKGDRIHVFDRQMTLPPGFDLVSNQIAGFEDVRMQTLFFQGEGQVFLNILIQEALSRKFDVIEYPANDPFFIFEKGTAEQDKRPVNWTVFSGDYKGDWVAGIGAYYFVDDHHRISLVMTSAIASPGEAPPRGLRLTKTQKLAVDAFSEQWLENIKRALDAQKDGSQ
ncbi:hypothetical protein [Desulfobacula sp.]|uniref:hypothetical protein n=1 Tax=Desulfobacula sp. TaxID=2593537 RepID=UPI0026311E07|nr:hypothetical protein [Desulfobacula sp.]